MAETCTCCLAEAATNGQLCAKCFETYSRDPCGYSGDGRSPCERIDGLEREIQERANKALVDAAHREQLIYHLLTMLEGGRRDEGPERGACDRAGPRGHLGRP